MRLIFSYMYLTPKAGVLSKSIAGHTWKKNCSTCMSILGKRNIWLTKNKFLKCQKLFYKKIFIQVEEFVVDYISLILVHSCHVQCFNYGLHLNVSESNCWQLAWCSNWSSSHRNFWQYEHLKILPPRGERINRSAYAFTNISICLFYQKSTLFNTSEI